MWQRDPVQGEMSDKFKDHVLEWLKGEYAEGTIQVYIPSAWPTKICPAPPIQVREVTCYGTDWAGGTEEGFYSETDITIRWLCEVDHEHYAELKGELFMSLWHWVVNSWKDVA
jgi:hypothetical protein